MYQFLIHLTGGIFLGLAWLQKDNLYAPLLTSVAILLLLIPLKDSQRSYSSIWLYGITAYLTAFYWLIESINSFGGYPLSVSTILFIIFCLLQSLVFPLSLFLYNKLHKSLLAKAGLTFTCSWITVKYIFPEIFPWHFAATFVEFKMLAKLAEFGGTTLVTFICLGFIESLLTFLRSSKANNAPSKYSFISIIALSICLALLSSKKQNEGTLNVSVIQGPVSVQKYAGVSYLAAKVSDYWQLSLEAISKHSPELIIWPESVVVNPVNDLARNIRYAELLPYHPKTSFLTGAISTIDNAEIFNSAFLIRQDGSISEPYHKQILMPFGEYMPFSNLFPFLNEMNPNLAIVSPGKDIKVMESAQARVSPLICYEDLVSDLSRIASKRGSNLLVNLTNDAWFGNTMALHQHNRLARYRAIENGRYLIRSTNSGLTSIINPDGTIESSLKPFSSGIINANIKLYAHKTVYTYFYGYLFRPIIVILTLLFVLIYRKKHE